MIRWMLLLAFCAVLGVVYPGTMYATNGIQATWPVTDEQAVVTGTSYATPKVLIDYYWHFPNSRIEEWDAATAAMDAINQGMKNCIAFTTKTMSQLPPARHALFFRPEVVSPSQPTTSCKSVQDGYQPVTLSNQGQTVVLFGDRSRPGAKGCLESNPRETLRVILNAVGMGNEYQRTDRSVVMTVHADVANRISDRYTGAFDQRSDLSISSDFDVKSATMIRDTEFAKEPSLALFTLPPDLTVPNTARLSYSDCRTLSLAYGCSITCDPDPATSDGDEDFKSSIHCWSPTEAVSAIAGDDVGVVGEIKTDLDVRVKAGMQVQVTPASANLKAKVVGTDANRKVVVSLKNKIKQGLDTTVLLQIKLDGTPIFTRSVKAKVSCLPRLNFFGKDIPCKRTAVGAVGNDAAGFSDEECAPDTASDIVLSNCVTATDEGRHVKDNTVLPGRVVVTDPDCTSCELFADLGASANAVAGVTAPYEYWKMSAGTVRWFRPNPTEDYKPANKIEPGSKVDFHVVILDDTGDRTVSYKVTRAIRCSDARGHYGMSSKFAFYRLLSKFPHF